MGIQDNKVVKMFLEDRTCKNVENYVKNLYSCKKDDWHDIYEATKNAALGKKHQDLFNCLIKYIKDRDCLREILKTSIRTDNRDLFLKIKENIQYEDFVYNDKHVARLLFKHKAVNIFNCLDSTYFDYQLKNTFLKGVIGADNSEMFKTYRAKTMVPQIEFSEEHFRTMLAAPKKQLLNFLIEDGYFKQQYNQTHNLVSFYQACQSSKGNFEKMLERVSAFDNKFGANGALLKRMAKENFVYKYNNLNFYKTVVELFPEFLEDIHPKLNDNRISNTHETVVYLQLKINQKKLMDEVEKVSQFNENIGITKKRKI